ncbi:MAG: hypothetical protein IJ468_11205 [Lachnospiraceae bacterium]|nr:hypothetical protein [Lachnospiraceae bacterium]
MQARWDLEGLGVFDVPAELEWLNEEKSLAQTVIRYRFQKEGIHFPVLRAVSSRNPKDQYIRIKNLDRARVTVTE